MQTKTYSCTLLALLLMVVQMSFAQASNKVEVNFASIASKIVNQSLQVKPGESVLITGTPAELKLMEQLFIAVGKAGGQASIQVYIPEAEKTVLMEASIEHLKLPNTFSLMQARSVDCMIITGSTQNPQLLTDVPEERLAASRMADFPLQTASSLLRFRGVGLGQTGGIPSESYAKFKKASYEELTNMFWNAVDVDYDKMRMNGEALSKLFKENAEVVVTSEAGTNLKLRLDKVPVRVNSGLSYANNPAFTGPSVAWLPAGEVYTCVHPASASGLLVVPSTSFRGQVIKNLKLQFSNGRITGMQADTNIDNFKKALQSATGDKDVLSLIDIGINPNSHSLSNSDFYSWEMGGMVTIGIGGNLWAGGNVLSDYGLSFHIPNATVTLDGKTIVNKGKLADK